MSAISYKLFVSHDLLLKSRQVSTSNSVHARRLAAVVPSNACILGSVELSNYSNATENLQMIPSSVPSSTSSLPFQHEDLLVP